jgi:hypothetical protein
MALAARRLDEPERERTDKVTDRVHARVETTRPTIQAEIAEACAWPLFTESQEEILAALAADDSLSLPLAYCRIALPKVVAALRSSKRTPMVALGGYYTD